MSWSDIFYPGNPGRRNKVIQLYTEIVTMMDGNFMRTNDLIDVIHTHLPGKTFLKIAVSQNETIRHNCDVFINKITEIQKYLTEKKRELKQNLEPDLYRKIMDTKVNFGQKLELGRTIGGATLNSIGGVTGIAVCATMAKGKFLVSLVEKFGKFRACAAAGIVIGVVVMGIDMIASAIIGAVERGKLEESIAELEEAKKSFKPASYAYCRKIDRVAILIEMSLIR